MSIYMELEIPNEWGLYLYDILKGIREDNNLRWIINSSEILTKEKDDFPELLDNNAYENATLFNTINEVCYVISLDMHALGDDGSEDMHVRISDSSYVEIWIYENAIWDKFKNNDVISNYVKRYGEEAK